MSNERKSVIQRFPPQDGDGWDCQCARCGSSCHWEECYECGGDGLDGHECGEDCCMCLYPDDNVCCDLCNGCGGEGGEDVCLSSPAWCEANPLPGREHVKRGAIEWYPTEESE